MSILKLSRINQRKRRLCVDSNLRLARNSEACVWCSDLLTVPCRSYWIESQEVVADFNTQFKYRNGRRRRGVVILAAKGEIVHQGTIAAFGGAGLAGGPQSASGGGGASAGGGGSGADAQVNGSCFAAGDGDPGVSYNLVGDPTSLL